MTADLRENCHFGAFHIFTYFSPKWANIYFSSVLWSTGGCFHHFKRLFGELKKLKIFPTPALREKCHFGHFTNLHISHPNGQIFIFQVSCDQVVVIFISFKDFPESKKNCSFSLTRTCEIVVILGHFTFSLISHPNEQIFTFQVSCGQLVVVFIILRGILECWKNWSFPPPQPCLENVILGISQICMFLIQMGKYLHFKCPVVNWWWISSVLKTFQKVKKTEVFHDRDLRENCHFGAFHIFTYFSPKWANIYFTSVLWSTGGGFYHFKRFFGKLKKLKFSPTPALREKCHFGHFTNLHISHPNGQIFIIQVSCCQLVVIFISF